MTPGPTSIPSCPCPPQTNGVWFLWLRYGEWLLTCPVILIHLSNITGLGEEYSKRRDTPGRLRRVSPFPFPSPFLPPSLARWPSLSSFSCSIGAASWGGGGVQLICPRRPIPAGPPTAAFLPILSLLLSLFPINPSTPAIYHTGR